MPFITVRNVNKGKVTLHSCRISESDNLFLLRGLFRAAIDFFGSILPQMFSQKMKNLSPIGKVKN